MKSGSGNSMRLALMALAALGVLVLTIMTCRSFARLFAPAEIPAQAEASASGSGPNAAPQASTPKTIVLSAGAIAPETERSLAGAGMPPEFETDADAIRKRERSRAAVIETVRRSIQTAAAETGDTNAAIEQEKALRQMEESGASFL